MTYIACILNKNGIVISADSRANYFEDHVESGKIKGKLVKFYWDGNKKLFLLKKKFAVASQGLLYWGDQRMLLKKHIENFEKALRRETVKSVATKIHRYFKRSKRKNTNETEVMHFLVCGIERGMPTGVFVNIHYDEKKGIQRLPFSVDKTLYVNGDGKGKLIEDVLGIRKSIKFCEDEVLKKHSESPFDVGNQIDTLVVSLSGHPYWEKETEHVVDYGSYQELLEAIRKNKLKIEILKQPAILFYKNRK